MGAGRVKRLAFLLVLLLHLSIIRTAESCLVRKRSVGRSIWSSKNYKRNESKCTCGELPDDGEPPLDWYVDIEVSFGRDDMKAHQVTYCLGTTVTSNLIATSHRCLMKPNGKLNIYDTWNPLLSKSDLARVQDIKVTYKAGGGSKSETKEVPLKKVIVNPHFAISSATDNFPDEDLALLVVADNTWFSKAILGDASDICESEGPLCHDPPEPICIPTVSDANKLLYRHAYSVGIGGASMDRRELRSSGRSLILSGTDCDMARKTKQVSNVGTVCVKTAALPPDLPGGPLIINSNDSKKTAFLAGMTSWVGEEEFLPIQGLKYLYFSHIAPLVKYIEWHAEKQKSGWCESPEFNVPDLIFPKSHSEDLDRGWEKPDRYKRDDSLDCVCGRKGNAQGRIVGGKEADEGEFPWMTILDFYGPVVNGSCGGTIINDRMILTAAHCFYNSSNPGIIASIEHVGAVLGAHNFTYEVNTGLTHFIIHPDYYNVSNRRYLGSVDFDIALLILKTPLTEQDLLHIVPICLPPPGQRMKIIGVGGGMSAGWGDYTGNENDPKYKPYLKKVHVPILKLEECKKVSSSVFYDTKICGTVKNSTTDDDTSLGDSGGPLMIQRNGNSFQGQPIQHWIQVGIVSYGTGRFGAYSDLQTLMPFVDYHAQKVGAKWCKYEPDSAPSSVPPKGNESGGEETASSTVSSG